MLETIINVIGWIASVLIVGAYFLNIRGKLSAQSKWYILANLIGGLFFIVNTIYLKAYPSALVNVIWVIIAIASLLQPNKRPAEASSKR
ncbi:MAG: hypothetical protein MUF62_01215 [Chitinophagaceae bacterium]|nr:hypothetical protein [Chitinophagaceae bacterium]